MNPIKLLQIKSGMNQFEKRHPKLPRFFETFTKRALNDGTVIEINVTTPDGGNYVTNLKLTSQDIQFLKDMDEVLHERTIQK